MIKSLPGMCQTLDSIHSTIINQETFISSSKLKLVLHFVHTGDVSYSHIAQYI